MLLSMTDYELNVCSFFYFFFFLLIRSDTSPFSTSILAYSTLCVFYKNLFHKNIEAEINQNFKSILRTFLRLRVD